MTRKRKGFTSYDKESGSKINREMQQRLVATEYYLYDWAADNLVHLAFHLHSCQYNVAISLPLKCWCLCHYFIVR